MRKADRPVLEVLATTPMRAFLYSRASVDPTGRGRSTADQEADNERTCVTNGWTVAGKFVDIDRSASRHSKRIRKDWEAMVAAIRRGEADVIVAWEDSRAYRDTTVYQELKRLCEETGVLLCYGGRLYNLQANSTDRFVTGLGALQAEFESDRIRERVLRTTLSNAMDGLPHGRIPFGYRREYDPKTGDLIAQVIFEPEAAIVREIAERVCAGDTCYQIAKSLCERGLTSGTGKPWNADMVKGILLKPTYIAKRQHKGEIIGDAQWDPILDEKLYARCQRILTNPDRRTQKDNKVRWLLSGIVTCQCGGLIRMRRNRHAPSYVCIAKFCTAIRIDKLDDIVQAELLTYVERPEFAESLVAASASAAAAAAIAEADEMEAELRQARDLAKVRKLSVVSLAALEQEFQPLIDEARARGRAADVSPLLYRIAGDSAREVWADLDLPQRREVIRAVMTIQLNKAYSIGARYITPDRYTIEFLR